MVTERQEKFHLNVKSAILGEFEFFRMKFTVYFKIITNSTLFCCFVFLFLFLYCIFRHTNRDVVLAHVKGHYKEANLLIDEQQSSGLQSLQNGNEFNNNVYVNGILSALSPQASKLLIQQNSHMSQQNDQQLPQIRIQPLSQLSGNPSHLFLAEFKQQQQQQQSSSTKQPHTIPSTITQNPTNQLLPNSMAIKTQNQMQNQNQNQNSTLSGSTTANNDNNEMDEASSGLNSVNGWRGPAPYRCGLCHQVSNWKHVIQVS